MSMNNEQKQKLEEKVVVNEQATELVEIDNEAKKAKAINTGKKVLKGLGIAALGLLCFGVGKACGSRENNYEDSSREDIEADIENTQE